MVRRRNLPRWMYGILAFNVFAVLFNLGLVVYEFWHGQFWSGMRISLGIVVLGYLMVLMLYDIEQRYQRLIVVTGFIFFGLGVTSLVDTWIRLR